MLPVCVCVCVGGGGGGGERERKRVPGEVPTAPQCLGQVDDARCKMMMQEPLVTLLDKILGYFPETNY